jgi:regulator of sigma E protease
MSIAIAILGLGLLVLIHESGHFLASLAVGLRPRKFYIGFPPAVVRTKRGGVEYGIGAIPLGGFVTIPGMHRPVSHDAERRFARAVSEAPALAGPADRVRRALDGDDPDGALGALDELESAMRERKVSAPAAASAAKGLTELRDALGPDAYWKARTWKRLVAIAAGPAANILLAIVLFTFVFMTSAGKATTTVASVLPQSQAQTAGLQPGDRILAINGNPVQATDIPDRISHSAGRPLVLTVKRDGTQITIGPVAAKKSNGVYRLGFRLQGVGQPPVEAIGSSFRVTGIVTTEVGHSLGRLVTGGSHRDLSSPIGIVQASSDSVQQGAESYLALLGLISLSVALLNLLPLLPLDGGHLLFTIIEGARGRFVRREIYERVSVVGLAFVLLLFVIGLSNDIGRLGGG